MPTYIQRGDVWQARIRIAGYPTESESFPTKAQARHWATQREAELRAMKRGESPKRTLLQAMVRYQTEVAPTHRGARFEVLRINAFMRMRLPLHKMLDDITTDDMGKWRDSRLAQVSAGTVLREINILRSIFQTAMIQWGWCKSNPLKVMSKPAKPAASRRVMSDDERDRLLLALGYGTGTLSHQVAVMMLLALEIGMRAGELNGLSWARVHLERRFVELLETKNGDRREVPLSSRAVELLESMRGVDATQVFTVTPESRDALFRKAVGRCQIDGLTFHATRHTAATRIGKAGKLSLLEFTAMFGWRDPKMAMVYFNATAQDIAARLD